MNGVRIGCGDRPHPALECFEAPPCVNLLRIVDEEPVAGLLVRAPDDTLEGVPPGGVTFWQVKCNRRLNQRAKIGAVTGLVDPDNPGHAFLALVFGSWRTRLLAAFVGDMVTTSFTRRNPTCSPITSS